MTDGRNPRLDGPRSLRVVVASLILGGGTVALAAVASALGARHVWLPGLTAGAGLYCVALVAALLIERSERRRETREHLSRGKRVPPRREPVRRRS